MAAAPAGDGLSGIAPDPVQGSRPPVRQSRTADEWLSGLLLYLLVGGYVFVVYVVVLAFGGIDNDTMQVPWWLNAISLPIVILTVRPVRAWLRRGINSVVYDHHDDPYAVLKEVHERADADPAPAAMGPAIAAGIAKSLKLPYVMLETNLGGTPLTAVSGAPVDGAEILTIPLDYRHAPVGTLSVSARRPGDQLSEADARLLKDLGRQVGIALHAAQLTDALQASRRQIVTAREEERRRIRRDLHDGLGPTLASLRMQLSALRPAVAHDPAAAAIIDSLRDDVRAATADIRRLVYDLRPPMLDEFGLAGALRNLGAADTHAATARTVDVPDALPPLPAAVEVALYRIAAEALHNVDRHANAATCVVRLDASPTALTLTIADDGIGLPDGCTAGVGFSSMRERAAELGGTLTRTSSPGAGTVVTATIPVEGTG